MNIDFRIRVGNFFALALAVMAWIAGAARAEVDVVSWGYQTYDQGDIRNRYLQIAAGTYHTVALKNDGTVVAWGNNGSGQRTVPAGLAGVTQIAAGASHTVTLVLFTDCNTNDQRDSYELAKGWVSDSNANGRIDTCDQAAGDLDLNGIVDPADLALLLLDFGPCPECPTDFDANDVVDTADLALLLLNFGPTA